MVLVSCSSTNHKRSVGEVIDDSVISNKLKVKYLKDKTVRGMKINVDTWKGVVSLRGRVEGQTQMDRAVEIAERQQGVREVKSYLIITGVRKASQESQERAEPVAPLIEKPIVVEEPKTVSEPEPPVASDVLAPQAPEEPKPQFDDEPSMNQPPELTD